MPTKLRDRSLKSLHGLGGGGKSQPDTSSGEKHMTVDDVPWGYCRKNLEKDCQATDCKWLHVWWGRIKADIASGNLPTTKPHRAKESFGPETEGFLPLSGALGPGI